MARPIENQVIDGLCSLLTLADEAGEPWTAAQMAQQIREIVGGVHEGLWHDVSALARERQP